MSSWTCDLPNLTIANAATTSNAIGTLDDADAITIHGPAALTGTVTVQVEPTDTGTTWLNLTSAGSNITVGAAAAVVLSPVSFRQLRLSSSSAEGASRAFRVTKQFRVSR